MERMKGKDAKSEEKRLASLIAMKWQQEYSDMVRFVWSIIFLAVVQSNY